MLGEVGHMNRNLIAGAVALVLSGCGPSGLTLRWDNTAQYSTIDIERAFRVGDECQTWHRLATVPGDINTVKVLEKEGASVCYRLRGCTSTGCSAFTEPSWKGASH
jgi:hypothetical protein